MKLAYGMMLCLIMMSFAACRCTNSSVDNAGRFLSNAFNAFDTVISSANQVSSGLKTVAATQPVAVQPVVVRQEAPQAVVPQPVATPPAAAQSVEMQPGAMKIVSEESEDVPLVIPSDYIPPPLESSNVIVIPLQPLRY